MQILNNGRIGLGTGSVGGAKKLLDLAIEHVKERRQFGQPLADFELVQDKIGWMVSYLFGLESMAYLTCGLVDAGRPRLLARVGDLQGLRDRVPLVRGQPRAAARRRRGLHAGPALREDPPRHPDLSDLRGRERRDAGVHRALGGCKPVGEKLRGLGEIEPQRPDRLDRRARRLRRRAGSSARSARTGSRWPTRSSPSHADAVSDQVKRARRRRPRSCCASTSKDIDRAAVPAEAARRRDRRHLRPGRGALAGSARSSRTRASSPPARSATSPTPSAPAPRRASAASFGQIESNDDERMTAIAKLAYKRGAYGYALFED